MAITTPTRKPSRSPTRPSMKKKSPYKAAKSSPKATYSTRELSPKKAAGSKSLTKQQKKAQALLARKRAQEWAKKELGKKKVPSPADSPSVIVIDDDDDDDVKDDHKMCVENNVKVSTATTTSKSKTLNQHLSGLDIDNNQKLKKDVNDGTEDDDDSGKGDIFYDALGCLPKQKKNDDVAVEDVSDEEDDDEIRGLNSIQRNLQPSDGEWMEPLEHSPPKKNQEPCGKSFSTFTPVKPEPNGTSFSTYSPEPTLNQEESKGWGLFNMFSTTFSASKSEPKKQQEP